MGAWESSKTVGSFICPILNISMTIGMKLSVNVFFEPDGSVLLAQVNGYVWSRSFHFQQMNEPISLRGYWAYNVKNWTDVPGETRYRNRREGEH